LIPGGLGVPCGIIPYNVERHACAFAFGEMRLRRCFPCLCVLCDLRGLCEIIPNNVEQHVRVRLRRKRTYRFFAISAVFARLFRTSLHRMRASVSGKSAPTG